MEVWLDIHWEALFISGQASENIYARRVELKSIRESQLNVIILTMAPLETSKE
jgi:hypothetical protein